VVIDDILYVFGGRDVNGKDLDDIVALMITGQCTVSLLQDLSL
jgi:hypothetical protein